MKVLFLTIFLVLQVLNLSPSFAHGDADFTQWCDQTYEQMYRVLEKASVDYRDRKFKQGNARLFNSLKDFANHNHNDQPMAAQIAAEHVVRTKNKIQSVIKSPKLREKYFFKYLSSAYNNILSQLLNYDRSYSGGEDCYLCDYEFPDEVESEYIGDILSYGTLYLEHMTVERDQIYPYADAKGFLIGLVQTMRFIKGQMSHNGLAYAYSCEIERMKSFIREYSVVAGGKRHYRAVQNAYYDAQSIFDKLSCNGGVEVVEDHDVIIVDAPVIVEAPIKRKRAQPFVLKGPIKLLDKKTDVSKNSSLEYNFEPYYVEKIKWMAYGIGSDTTVKVYFDGEEYAELPVPAHDPPYSLKVGREITSIEIENLGGATLKIWDIELANE